MKTYRFTIEAFEEIDIKSNSLVEAQRKADEAWNKKFKGKGLFGGAEFKGVVEKY